MPRRVALGAEEVAEEGALVAEVAVVAAAIAVDPSK